MDPRIYACGGRVCLQGSQNMSKARWLIRTLLEQRLGSLPFLAHGPWGYSLFGREAVARTGDTRVNASEQNDHTYTRRRAASALSLCSRVTRTPYMYFHGTQRIGRFCAEFIASARLTSASGCDCGTLLQQPPGR